jgi:hypothetical protein
VPSQQAVARAGRLLGSLAMALLSESATTSKQNDKQGEKNRAHLFFTLFSSDKNLKFTFGKTTTLVMPSRAIISAAMAAVSV